MPAVSAINPMLIQQMPMQQQTTSPASPIMTMSPSAPVLSQPQESDAQWLAREADWLGGVDKFGSGIPTALDAILKNTSYGPGDPPVTVLQGLQNVFYTKSAMSNGQPVIVPAPGKLGEDASRLRQIADKLSTLEQQNASLAQELAQAKAALAAATNQPQAQPPAVVTPPVAVVTSAQPQQTVSPMTILVGVGVVAAAAAGAWWLWSRRRQQQAGEEG